MSAALSIQFKRCSVCNKDKPLSSFHRDAKTADGVRADCKVCRMNAGKTAKRHAAPRGNTYEAPAPRVAPMFDSTPADDASASRRDAADDMGDSLEIDAPDEPEAQGGGIGGLFSAMKGESTPRKPSSGDEQAQMAGVVARGAAFVLRAASLWAIPDPYKPAAPTREHALAIVSPLAEEASARMDVAGMLSPTTVRMAQAGLAIIDYGDYALTMIARIHEQQGGQHGGGIGAGTRGRSAATAAGYARSRGFVSVPAGAAAGAAFAGAENGGGGAGAWGAGEIQSGPDDAGADDSRYTARQAQAVDALLNADADGRARLGLV